MRIFRLVLVLAATGFVVPGTAQAVGAAGPSPVYSPGQSANGTIVPGTAPLAVPITLDDEAGSVALPFDFDFLGAHFAAGHVVHPTSNGVLDFDGTTAPFNNQCSPTFYPTTHVAMPLWDDLKVNGTGEGIFTKVTGAAPNRQFYIEWRAHLQSGGADGSVNFEVVLDENQSRMAFVYGSVAGAGATATIGISQAPQVEAQHKQFSCNAPLGAIKTVTYRFTAPQVLGLTQVGETLGTDVGSFVGSPTPTETVTWERCDAALLCAPIPGSSGTSYASVATDIGFTIRAVTSSLNGAGTSSVSSDPYGPVVGLPAAAPAYSTTASSGVSFIAATDDIGNHSDDDSTAVTLPFAVRFYGKSYAAVNVSANGSLTFGGTGTSFSNDCLPNDRGPDVFEIYQSDLDSTSPGDGIFTVVKGLAPHRTFVVEWRTASHNTLTDKAHFEAVLYEDSSVLTAIYGDTVGSGIQQVSGVQHGQGPPSTQFSCKAATLTSGTRVDYTPSVPALSGSATVGSVLGATAASWTGAPTLSQQWRRCDADGVNCGDIPLATAATYVVAGADIDHTLRLRETAVGPLAPLADSVQTALITNPPVQQPPPGGKDTTAPALTGLASKLKAFKALKRGGPTDAAKGPAVTFTLSEAASVRLSVSVLLSGRRSGKACVKATKARRKAKRCTRVVPLKGAFTVTGKAGVNTLHLTGRLSGKRLAPGKYRLDVVATDAAQNVGTTSSMTFTIKH